VAQGEQGGDQLHPGGGAHQVPELGFGVGHGHGATRVAQSQLQRLGLDHVGKFRAGAVSIDVAQVGGVDASIREGALDGLNLARGARLQQVHGVGGRAVAEDLTQDRGAALLRMVPGLEHQGCGALAHDQALAAGVEGAAGLGWILDGGQHAEAVPGAEGGRVEATVSGGGDGGGGTAVAHALEGLADGDRDGVADSQDACLTTLRSVVVDATGCALDHDYDGILDSHDQCLDSAAGAVVDSTGCEMAAVVILKGVQFESGSAQLKDESKRALEGLAKTLKRYPQMVVEVAGYTDSLGSAHYNKQLSDRRAKSVVTHLIAMGVNADNMLAKGYGPVDPVADNATAAGRAENRRVELHTLKR